MLSRVLSAVNGETALSESIVRAMSSISDMLCCLNGQLVMGRVAAHYMLRCLMAIGALSFRMQLLDLSE